MPFANRILVESASVGTGVMVIDNTVPGFEDLDEVEGSFYYIIHNEEIPVEYEIGIGTYDDGDEELSRERVLQSSNAGTLVDFSAGLKRIFVDVPATIIQQAFNIKAPVLRATLTNLNITSVSSIDAYTPNNNERFLLLGQTDESQNGIYSYFDGILIRTNDYYTGFISLYSFVTVLEGTYQGCVFLQTEGEIVDTDDITFTQYGPALGAGAANALAVWETANRLGSAPSWQMVNNKLNVHASYPNIIEAEVVEDVATLDLNAGNWFSVVAEDDLTIDIENLSPGQSFSVRVTDNGHSIAFGFDVQWNNGDAPTFEGSHSWLMFVYYGADEYGAPIFDGFISGENFS